MKILLINQDWFAAEWRAAGHEVVTFGFADHLEVRMKSPLLHIDTVIKALPNGFVPEVIVIHDNSAPVMIGGLEETAIPTVFYSVDTHHHVQLHRHVANVFDLTLVAQKDYIPQFYGISELPLWMPLWASRRYEASSEKQHGAVFVGNLDPKLNPARVKFFEELAQRVPILCKVGQYWDIFPYSEVVMNQTVKGDLNFRVFEAMMSGALLLTESSGNGLFDLFKEGQHLATYEKNNVEQAAERINFYLSNPARAREIGHAGRELILMAHTAEHRAQFLLSLIEKLEKKNAARKYLSAMVNYVSVARRMEHVDTGVYGCGLVAGVKACENALQRGEPMTTEIACYAVLGCNCYERLFRTGAGAKLLEELAAANPSVEVLQLARVRSLLNRGQRVEAEQLAKAISRDDISSVFRQAEEIVSSILSER